MCDDKNYSLVDEFLRIRVIMDVEEANVDDIEAALIESGEIPMPGQMFESFYENTGRVDDDY